MRCPWAPAPAPPVDEALRAWHRSQIVIDLHLDTVLQQRLFRYRFTRRHAPWLRGQPLFWHADLPRMREGGYGAACMTAHWFPWESERGWREAKRQLRMVHANARQRGCCLARTADEIRAAKRAGKIALLPVVEGAHTLNGRLERVEVLARFGVRYLTLTHFSRNRAATPGMGRGANQRDGLSGFGRELVRALEANRILVDVAHLNRPGVLEVCAMAKRPVIASHTTCSGLFDHPRGVTDEGLRAIAATGGVVGIMWAPNFQAGRLDVGLDVVVDHIFHAIEVAGIDHVAIGTDFDGWLPAIPNDVRDCRDLPWLTARLLERGLTRDEATRVLGTNALRVFSN